MLNDDRVLQFAARHLGGRAVPNDLRKLLELQWHTAKSRRPNPLIGAGVTLIDADQQPALVEAERTGRNNLAGNVRLAYAQAMTEMIRYSGFVAEQSDGEAIGYWFSPDQIPIETAPLMRFDRHGHFSILPGNGIAETLLVVASRANDRMFLELRCFFDQNGLNIRAKTIQEIDRPECSLPPQFVYQRLVDAYTIDLSTTSPPVTGRPANIMTTHRGPAIR